MANGSAEQRGEGTDASPVDLVDFLSGSPTYRQRAQTSFVSPPAIGKLLAVRGEVAVTRGKVVVVQPTVGDLVYQNDLIETGNNGLIDIAFVDGTTIRLYADAHLVLTEFVCSAEKSSNSALLHIAKGVFGFVAGKMATIGRLVIENSRRTDPNYRACGRYWKPGFRRSHHRPHSRTKGRERRHRSA